MARPLIDDALWALIEPLLPPPKPRRADHPGRRPVEARRCLTGIVFVLKTGIQWEDLPAEMGVSGMTCWRRLRDWQAAGVGRGCAMRTASTGHAPWWTRARCAPCMAARAPASAPWTGAKRAASTT